MSNNLEPVQQNSKARRDSVESKQQFLIESKLSIVAKFKQMIKAHVTLTAQFNNGQSLNTLVVEVLADKNIIALDTSTSEALNTQLTESSRIIFKGTTDGIEIQFNAESCSKATLHGEPVFAIPIPNELLWIQRREFYRVNVPLGIPAYCNIPQKVGTTKQYKLIDISAGGLSLQDEHKDSVLEKGDVIENCTLELPDFDAGTVSLKFCASFPMNNQQPKLGNRLGFEFINIGMSFAATIQRYIHSVETLRKRTED